MRLALAFVAAALAAPTAAQAATWSAPQNLSGPHTFVDDPRLLVSGDGTALALWTWQDGVTRGAVGGTSAASRPAGAAVFGRARAVVRRAPADQRTGVVAGPVTYGARRAIVAVSRFVSRDARDPRSAVGVRFGTIDGRFGKLRTVRRAPQITRPVLAANARGVAALAWFEDRGTRTDRVYVSLRRAGRRFGKPRRLATGRVRSVAVAVGPRGDVLVAWDARGVVKTRLRPAGRRGFRATDTLRSRDAFFAQIDAHVSASGRAVVAWSAQFASEGGEAGPVLYDAAVRPAGARRFRAAQPLGRGPADGQPRELDLAGDAAGRVLAGFSDGAPDARVVRVAALEPGSARFGAAATISAPGAVFDDLATGPDGRAIAVWDDGGFDATQVFAAVAPGAGAPFGPPEAVSPAQAARDGSAAFDPRTGEPTVVWTNRPAGSSGPVDAIRTFAQAATRSP